MRRFDVTLAVAAGVVSCASASAQVFRQIPLTYNADLVREAGGTVSAGIDFDGRAYVTQGEASLRDAVDPRGLPDNGVLQVPGGTIQLAPYNGNNAILLNSASRAGFAIPGELAQDYHYLGIYGAGVGHAPILRVFIDLEGGNAIANPALNDWTADGGTQVQGYVIDGMDRTGPQGAGFEDVDDVAMFFYPVFIRSPRPLSSISVSYDGPEGPGIPPSRAAIFAAALYVPEPTALAGLLLIGPLALRRRRRHV